MGTIPKHKEYDMSCFASIALCISQQMPRFSSTYGIRVLFGLFFMLSNFHQLGPVQTMPKSRGEASLFWTKLCREEKPLG
jgi:hypothetical protein